MDGDYYQLAYRFYGILFSGTRQQNRKPVFCNSTTQNNPGSNNPCGFLPFFNILLKRISQMELHSGLCVYDLGCIFCFQKMVKKKRLFQASSYKSRKVSYYGLKNPLSAHLD